MYDNEYILYINRYDENRLNTYEYLESIRIIKNTEYEENKEDTHE